MQCIEQIKIWKTWFKPVYWIKLKMKKSIQCYESSKKRTQCIESSKKWITSCGVLKYKYDKNKQDAMFWIKKNMKGNYAMNVIK